MPGRLACGCGAGFGCGCEKIAKVGAILVDHSLRHRLAALVIVAGIVKLAVEADVQRPVASRAMIAKTDPFPRIDGRTALPAIHDKADLLCSEPTW